MTQNEQMLVGVVQQLIAAVMPYQARHKVDRCFCEVCNRLRRVLNYAAETIETLQPPDL